MRDNTNKSPIKLNMQRKINWHGDLFTNGENLHDKNPIEWFYGHQPYTNLQLNSYTNTQLDLFCSDNLSF